MREIKFRAWQPFTSLHRKKGMYVVDDMVWHRVTEHQPNAGEVFLAKNVGWSQSSEYFEDVEIMQFSGLKDKNGVEIFEGDIIRGPGRLADEIVFRDGLFQTAGGYRVIYSDEVIGNRFENPELLEVTS